jgi:hypothetical protein
VADLVLIDAQMLGQRDPIVLTQHLGRAPIQILVDVGGIAAHSERRLAQIAAALLEQRQHFEADGIELHGGTPAEQVDRIYTTLSIDARFD